MKYFSSALIAAPLLLAAGFTQAATFNVSTVSEFREALIDAANNGEDNEILLSPGVYSTIEDERGGFVYNAIGNHALIIQDSDLETQHDVILDGGAIDQVLLLQNEKPDGDYMVRGITIQNGARGLRVNNGDLRLDQARILNNTVNEIGGGLLFSNTGQDLYISNSLFKGNTTTYTNAHGGGAYISSADLLIESTRFELNESNNYGGGVYIKRVSHDAIGIRESTFVSNTATFGGGVKSATASLRIESSRFEQNHTENGGGAFHGSGTIDRNYFYKNSTDGSGSAVVTSSGKVSNSYFIENAKEGAFGVQSALICSNISEQCLISNNLFDGNIGNTVVTVSSGSGSTDNIIANNVFLSSSENIVGKGSSSAVVNLKNNFFPDDKELSYSSDSQYQSGNIVGGSAGLDESYNVIDGSILIDAGTNYHATLYDYLGHSRRAGDAIDIGPIEYGSTITQPIITAFEYASGNKQNLELITFDLDYSLLEGRVIRSLSFDDGSGEFVEISLSEQGQFSYEFIEPGEKELQVKVEDDQNEKTVASLKLDLAAKLVSEVIEIAQETCLGDPESCKIDVESHYESGFAAAKAACGADPSSCGIDLEVYYNAGHAVATKACEDDPSQCNIITSDYVQEGKQACIDDPEACGVDLDPYYNSGYVDAMAACKDDPSQCEIDTAAYVEQGKQVCIDDPGSCGIKANFDPSQIPNFSGEGWKLLGTGEAITDMAVLGDIDIVWAQVNGIWRAYSPDADTVTLLENNSVPLLSEIPAFSGFWVKK